MNFHVRFLSYGSVIRFAIPKEDKIVDIGCDIGKLFPDYQNVTNVDNRSMKQISDDYYAGFHQRINLPNFIQADATDLPFESLEFDWAVLCEILEHVEDPVKILNEAQRVASHVALSVPNEWQWGSEKKPFGEHHVRYYKEETLLEDIQQSGLNIIEYVKILFSGWSHFVVWGISKFALENEIKKETTDK